jgi:hypothetical protein
MRWFWTAMLIAAAANAVIYDGGFWRYFGVAVLWVWAVEGLWKSEDPRRR